jgi:hypothetical protein
VSDYNFDGRGTFGAVNARIYLIKIHAE